MDISISQYNRLDENQKLIALKFTKGTKVYDEILSPGKVGVVKDVHIGSAGLVLEIEGFRPNRSVCYHYGCRFMPEAMDTLRLHPYTVEIKEIEKDGLFKGVAV